MTRRRLCSGTWSTCSHRFRRTAFGWSALARSFPTARHIPPIIFGRSEAIRISTRRTPGLMIWHIFSTTNWKTRFHRKPMRIPLRLWRRGKRVEGRQTPEIDVLVGARLHPDRGPSTSRQGGRLQFQWTAGRHLCGMQRSAALVGRSSKNVRNPCGGSDRGSVRGICKRGLMMRDGEQFLSLALPANPGR